MAGVGYRAPVRQASDLQGRGGAGRGVGRWEWVWLFGDGFGSEAGDGGERDMSGMLRR
jgi:hypothetical protein